MNLFEQSQDPGASQIVEVKLESRCCAAVTGDAAAR